MERKNKVGVILVIIIAILALAAVLVCLYLTAKQLSSFDDLSDPVVNNRITIEDDNTTSNTITNRIR